MLNRFLTPRIDRLGSDGHVEEVHPGTALGRLRPRVLLLGRELCTFFWFDAGAMSPRRRRQAARLHARIASPYLVSGGTIVKAGAGFGVWWWDLARIQPWLQDQYGTRRPVIRPETLAQPPGRDWRILKLDHGYELQWWQAGALMASAWRAIRPDATSWSGFARLQRGAEDSGSVPVVEQVPIALNSEAFVLSGAEITREQAVLATAGGFAMIAMIMALFWAGQALQLRSDADKLEIQAATLGAGASRPQALQVFENDRRRMAAFQEIEQRTNPISSVGAALAVLAIHDLQPTQIEATVDSLTLTLPYAASRQSDELVEEFEASGYFYDVQPAIQSPAAALKITMKVRERAPPLNGP
ncbi:hypothetical protein [Brevundimonas sp. TWP2-3-4b1]|uniref:hypothetical protein n=1 Tax=Brevundimonas sp. TWP2-3-4b1 TaxID=2804580 RepID=UPI003CFB70BB